MSERLIIDSLLISEDYNVKWIPSSEFTSIESSQNAADETISYAQHGDDKRMLLLLGNDDKCTPTLVSEFARIYSLPTYKYNNVDNNFRRYSKWLEHRNELIKGFTEYKNNYYMVADKSFIIITLFMDSAPYVEYSNEIHIQTYI